jgi:hypothetical protein
MNSWDNRRDREIRQTLQELRVMDEGGYFDGLNVGVSVPENLKVQAAIQAHMNKGAPFAKRVAGLKPLDNPVGPALTQFMSQLMVR